MVTTRKISNAAGKDAVKVVIPGDKLAVIEEFFPADFCFESTDGYIYSCVVGIPSPDEENRQMRVEPLKKPFTPRAGQIGIAYVTDVKRQIAFLELYAIENQRMIPSVSAYLHISWASYRYVSAMYDVCRPGDWLLVQLLNSIPPIYLSLKGRGLGVISANCNYCGANLKFKRPNMLYCKQCNKEQPRITSSRYEDTTLFSQLSF